MGFLIPTMPIYKLRTHKAGQLVNYDDDVFAGDSREQLRGSTKSSTGHFSPGSVGGAQISPRPPDMSQFFNRYSKSTIHPQVYKDLCKFDIVLLNFTFHHMVRSNPTEMFSKFPIANNFPLSKNMNDMLNVSMILSKQ